MTPLTYTDVQTASRRVTGRIREVVVARSDPAPADTAPGGSAEVYFALEHLQYTGTFKARGAQNFLQAHLDAGGLPGPGVTIASGGNAGMACAWAARQHDVTATVFLPDAIPQVKIDRLRGHGAKVRLIAGPFADAWDACDEFAAESGALQSHAYDNPLIGAGAGTLMMEIVERIPDLDTVVVAVGGGGLFSGVAAVAERHGIRTIAVEPAGARTLNAAIEAGRPVDVDVDSVAADSLGGRRASSMALHAAQHGDVLSVLVPDAEIIRARQHLWDEHRLAVEHAAGTALAGIHGKAGYRPAAGERVCVVLCGANTDPADLT